MLQFTVNSDHCALNCSCEIWCALNGNKVWPFLNYSMNRHNQVGIQSRGRNSDRTYVWPVISDLPPPFTWPYSLAQIVAKWVSASSRCKKKCCLSSNKPSIAGGRDRIKCDFSHIVKTFWLQLNRVCYF